MAINDTNDRVDPQAKRVKLPGVDHPVRCPDPVVIGGKQYKSTSYKTVIPSRAHILPDARNGAIEPMIVVNVEPCDSSMPDLNADTIEIAFQYFNRSNRPIRVTDRHNLSFTLPSARMWNPNGVEHFVVRKLYRFSSSEVALSYLYNHSTDQRHLSIEDGERMQILAQIDEDNRKGNFRNPNGYKELKVDRIIPITMLYEYGSLYVSDVDLLFRFEGTEIGTPHPTSQDAVLRGEVLDILDGRRLTGAVYEIVDNKNAYSSRYVCLGKDTLQIPINRDPGRAAGIYYTTFDSINVHDLRVTMNCVELEKAEGLGIYPTAEEAKTKGHINDSFKLELAEAERKAKRWEAELHVAKTERQAAIDELAHERAMEKLSQEREASTVEHVQLLREIAAKINKTDFSDRLDVIAQERKDYFDQRSVVRKDTSEVLKWIPTALNGLLALFVLGVAIGAGNKGKK